MVYPTQTEGDLDVDDATTSSFTDQHPTSQGLGVGVIAGIAVACLLIVIGVILTIIFVRKRHRNLEWSDDDDTQVEMPMETGEIVCGPGLFWAEELQSTNVEHPKIESKRRMFDSFDSLAGD